MRPLTKCNFASFLISLVFLFCVVGCGDPEKPELHGTVSLDGEPLQSGTIQLIPQDGTGTTDGAAITEGKYSVGTTSGKKRVQISSKSATKSDALYEGGPIVESYVESVPSKYNTQTSLSISVDGKTEHNFALSTKEK